MPGRETNRALERLLLYEHVGQIEKKAGQRPPTPVGSRRPCGRGCYQRRGDDDGGQAAGLLPAYAAGCDALEVMCGPTLRLDWEKSAVEGAMKWRCCNCCKRPQLATITAMAAMVAITAMAASCEALVGDVFGGGGRKVRN